MKKVITIILLLALILSLVACSNPKITKIESTQVSAIVYQATTEARWEYHYIYVAYEGAENRWYDESGELYDYYSTRLGTTIECYLITKTYENGQVERTLVYNEDLWKNKGE